MPAQKTLTYLTDLFFLWILLHFGMGGWETARLLLTQFGVLPWVILSLVVFLVVYRSNYKIDLPLFGAGLLLGYWGEWWGTTRGVWTYWNGATPPDYLPPLWGIGLLTVYRLSLILRSLLNDRFFKRFRWILLVSFILIPALAITGSLPVLLSVDWSSRIDAHFAAGLAVAITLILYRFELARDFPIYLCGTLLGGLYEYLGTSMGEWAYITAEVPPLWIAPLWGLASVAMHKLALLIRQYSSSAFHFLQVRWRTSVERKTKNSEEI